MRAPFQLARGLSWLLLWHGCSLGASESPLGPAPSRETGPFAPVENPDGGAQLVEAPFILSELGSDLSDPSVVPLSEGFGLYFSKNGTSIWRVDFPGGLFGKPGAPVEVLRADRDWESDRVTAADVRLSPSGYRMVYEAGPLDAPSIGTATSQDGRSWTKGAAPAALGRSPTWLGQRIAYQDRDAVWLLGDLSPLVLDARAPSGRTEPTAAGRTYYDLFFLCPGRHQVAVCFAGSLDGVGFERAGATPVLETSGAVFAPFAITIREQSLLFYASATGGHLGLAAALSP